MSELRTIEPSPPAQDFNKQLDKILVDLAATLMIENPHKVRMLELVAILAMHAGRLAAAQARTKEGCDDLDDAKVLRAMQVLLANYEYGFNNLIGDLDAFGRGQLN